MAKLVIGTNKQNGVPAIVVPSNVTDEYANYITIENTIKGTTYAEQTEIATARNQISQFLFGTNNS